MIEKTRKLRTMEYTFTDDQIHPVCHCEYINQITEDGLVLATSIHRECCDVDECIAQIQGSKKYIYPEVVQ